MKKQEDPLALVRESRLRISHEQGNDPKRVVAELHREEGKYARQIEQYRLAMVHEGSAEYGGKKEGA